LLAPVAFFNCFLFTMIVPKFFSSIASALPFLLVSSVVVVVPSRGQATGGTCSGVKEIIYNGECATQNPLYSNVCVFGEGGVSIVLRNGFGQDNVFSSCCPLEEAFARIPNPGTGGVTVVDPANPPVCAPGTDFEALLPFACEDIALSGSTPPPPRPDRACLVCSATTVPTVCDQLRSVSGGTQPLTNANIQAAVSAYIAGDPTVRSLYGDPINAWDVSLVTDMAGLFENQGGFNEPLECWDVSSVTNMDNMFSSTMGFMQPLEQLGRVCCH
jgi:surface protein